MTSLATPDTEARAAARTRLDALAKPLGALGRAGWPVVRPAMRAGVRLSLRRFAAFARDHRG